MPKARYSIEMAASPWYAWKFISDLSYMPKIFPNVVSVKADPQGPTSVGQKIKIIGRVARRKVEMLVEVTEVEPNAKLTFRAIPGGPLKTYLNTVTLTRPREGGTKITSDVEYEVVAGLGGKLLSAAVIRRIAKKTATQSLRNLKEIAELEELLNSGSG